MLRSSRILDRVYPMPCGLTACSAQIPYSYCVCKQSNPRLHGGTSLLLVLQLAYCTKHPRICNNGAEKKNSDMQQHLQISSPSDSRRGDNAATQRGGWDDGMRSLTRKSCCRSPYDYSTSYDPERLRRVPWRTTHIGSKWNIRGFLPYFLIAPLALDHIKNL
jgi:hypothetical protein